MKVNIISTFKPKSVDIAFHSPMMFQPTAASQRSYRHVSICSHQVFVIGLRPIQFCSFVHRTQQNCMHRTRMHREWNRRAHGLLPLEVARYVLFLPDFEHEATAQNEIEKQREKTRHSINTHTGQLRHCTRAMCMRTLNEPIA